MYGFYAAIFMKLFLHPYKALDSAIKIPYSC